MGLFYLIYLTLVLKVKTTTYSILKIALRIGNSSKVTQWTSRDVVCNDSK